MAQKIASLFAEIGADTSKFDRGAKNVRGGLTGLKAGFSDALKVTAAFSGAIIAVGKAYDATVNKTIEYNRQVRELSQVTGTGTKEISRIVQVADDWGVSIDEVRTSLAMMNKNGVAPTVDNLAKLADEYVNTTDKTAFAEKAAKLLGRQYTTLIPLFAKGGDALRAQTEAVSDNLIATDESIKASREYEVAVDNLTDAWQGFTMQVGNQVIPLLTQLLTPAQEEVIDGQKFLVQRIGDSVRAFQQVGQATIDVSDKYDALTGGPLRRMAEAQQKFYDDAKGESGLDLMGADAEAAAEKLKLIPVALEEVTKASFASAAIDAVTKAFQDGLIPQSKYDELMRKIGDKFTDLTDDEINQQILLANLSRSYDEGRIPIEDYIKTLENLGFAWGEIPRNVSTTYTIHYQKVNPAAGEPGPDVPVVIPGGGNESGSGAVTPRAAGGPVMAGMSYLVGEKGPEIFTPGAGGNITPNNALGGDVYADITINAAPGMDVNAIAAAVVAKLNFASRNNRAGGAYRGA